MEVYHDPRARQNPRDDTTDEEDAENAKQFFVAKNIIILYAICA